jgi:hypothetical protein
MSKELCLSLMPLHADNSETNDGGLEVFETSARAEAGNELGNADGNEPGTSVEDLQNETNQNGRML